MATNYDIEMEALLSALKDAKQMQGQGFNAGIPANRIVGGRYVAPGLGELISGAVTPALGQISEQNVRNRQRKLGDEEQAEFDRLQQELVKPLPTTKRVLKQTLGPGQEGLEQEIDTPLNPEEMAMAEHQRRMTIAPQMMRLPKARGLAEKLYAKGVDFPEKLAELQYKTQDAGANKAEDRLLKQAIIASLEAGKNARNTENNRVRIELKGMGGGGGGGGGESVSYQQKGYTPEGEVVSYNPKDGQMYVKGQPYVGEISTGSDFSKSGGKRRDIAGNMAQADKLIKQVEENKDAFGITPGVASYLPNIIGNRITSSKLSPAQMDARAAVAQDAAVLINDIYGAALSAGEGRRANSWAWEPGDNYDTTMSKLRQAKEWAAGKQKASGKITTSGGGGGAPSSGKIKILSVE